METKMIITVLIFFLLSSSTGVANTKKKQAEGREVIITSNEETIRATVSTERKNIRINNERTYFGYYLNGLYGKQGEIQGKPLDGRFCRYDVNDNILESGSFKMGLKEGIWKKFSKAGFLTEISQYRNGMLDGQRVIYKDGQPDIIEKYRYGKLRGKPKYLNPVKGSADKRDKNAKKEKPGVGEKEHKEPANRFINDTENFVNPETTPEDAKK